MRSAVYAVWPVPLGELTLLMVRQANYWFRFRSAPWKLRLLTL
jgi:hypothetical protein